MTKAPRSLLFLCHTLPYPPDGGVWMRSYHVLRELSREFRVTALCFERLATTTSAVETEASVAHLRQFAEVEVFMVPQNRSRLALVWNHVRSTALRRVYTRYIYESGAYAARIKELIDSRHFDLVHLDSLDLTYYADQLGNLPVICTHHNVESALLAKRAEAERPWVRSQYLRFQSRLMQQEEAARCPRFALNIVCSDADLRMLHTLSPSSRGAVVPNGIDVDEFRPVDAHAKGVVFVGGTSWFPNRDALEYFSKEILPHIRQVDPNCMATWVGTSTAQERVTFGTAGVHLTGYVDDVRPYIAEALVFVVPLRVGGGTRLKILAAWGMGAAVVTTSIGCEGLEAVDGVNCLIRDDAAAFAAAVIEVATDASLRRRLGQAARRSAESTYSWPVIGQAMVKLYGDAIESSGKAGR